MLTVVNKQEINRKLNMLREDNLNRQEYLRNPMVTDQEKSECRRKISANTMEMTALRRLLLTAE